MANMQAKIDDNSRASLIAVTDDSNAEIRRLVVDPVTNRLKVSAVIAGAPGNLAILDHTVLITNTPTSLDFEGSGFVLTNVGDNVTLTFTPSMVIGEAVTGGNPTDILFVDTAGNLGQDANFTYDTVGQIFHVGFPGKSFIDINAVSQQYFFGDIGAQHELYIDGTTGTIQLISYGQTQLRVSDATGIQEFGDISGDWNSNILNINGASRVITLQDNGNPFLSIDKGSNQYKLGDINNTNNGYVLDINDSGGAIAGLVQLQSINAFNLAYPYYTFGDNTSVGATYFQAHNDIFGSSLIMNGNAGNLGIQTNGFSYDFFNRLTGWGDTGGVYNQTAILQDDNLSTIDMTGMKGMTSAVIPLVGGGLDNLTWGGFYTGIASDTYNVWIVTVGNGFITYTPPSDTGLPLVGTATSSSGGTADIVSDDGIGNLYLTNIAGTFNPTDTVTDGTSTITIDTFIADGDGFNWTDTLTGLVNAGICDTLPQTLSNGITVQWATIGGHTIGTPVNSWQQDIVISGYGRTYASDGQLRTVTIGDVDSVGNGTYLQSDDMLGRTTNTGTPIEPNVLSLNFGINHDYHLGFPPNVQRFSYDNATGASDFTLPDTIVKGMIIEIFDASAIAGTITNNITIKANGNFIVGSIISHTALINQDGQTMRLFGLDSTHWKII